MFEAVSPAELVAVIDDAHREESRLMARKLAAIWSLLLDRMQEYETDPDAYYSSVSGVQRTIAEVGAAMNLSPRAASFMVSYADALANRLPKVAALLADGRTDWRTVELIINRTDLVVTSAIDQIDESLAARIVKWRSWSRRRIINAVDATVIAADPDAARERRVAAEERDRHVTVTPLPEGMARLHGSVTAAAGAAFDKRLSEMAMTPCADDPRTVTQRRADAVTAIGEGRALECKCDRPNCPSRSREADQSAGTRIVINVVASEDTVRGRSQEPGYLAGYGLIDADQVRGLAEAARSRMLDPTVSSADALRYQPSASLERFIRCRDLTCRFPGCDRPAERCDIDHTIPFNHLDPASGGLTVPENLKCLCRQHHRLKTFVSGPAGWRDQQLSDGTIIWTSPTGEVYRTTPGAADLFPTLARPACSSPKRRRVNHTKDRAARIARARRRNRGQRPLNAEHSRVRQAIKKEIDGRKFRNHMRDMLFLFKGKPSTNPRCAWINDPYEPEELPPDWKPPPKPPPLPDEPPF